MKQRLPKNLEKFRDTFNGIYPIPPEGSIFGAFVIPYTNKRLAVISASDFGWDHVSVSLRHRCPTWDEMCWIKKLFFEPEELVFQFHPPESRYRNLHPYCLHLWRPWTQKFELPPTDMIG